MGTNSVVIRRCASLPEAYVCWGLLRANGFEASLDNANYAAIDWGAVHAIGGIAIRVPISQFERAKTCIVESVEVASALNTKTVKMTFANRMKAVSMLLIFFGVIEFLGAILIIWLASIVPSNWLPTASDSVFYVSTHTGLGIAPPGPGIEGLLFMMLVSFLLLWELISTRPPKLPKEPQV